MVRFPIIYRGKDAGWVAVQQDGRGMMFEAESPVRTLAVLRLYGLTGADPLLIGVLEPENGILRLRRRITPEALRTAGVQQPPAQYYLEDGQPGCRPDWKKTDAISEEKTEKAPIQTGDMLLDHLITSGTVSCVADADGWTLQAPFVPGRAHPLHFALTACMIKQEHGKTIVVLRKQKSP